MLTFVFFLVIIISCFIFYAVYTLPLWLIRFVSWVNPSVLFYSVDSCKKQIALTLDDSLHPSLTSQALEVLSRHGAKATFFIIGDNSDTVEGRDFCRIVMEGNELGNHTWYDRPSWRLPIETLKRELIDVDKLIYASYKEASLCGSDHSLVGNSDSDHPFKQPKWFRPGHGFFNAEMLLMAQSLGYRTVLGSVYPHDPAVSMWRLNSWLVLRRVRPGSIIILHDRRSWLIPTLECIIPALIKRGYSFVTLSQMFLTEPNESNNCYFQC